MWAAGTASHILANLEKALVPFCPAAALRMYYLIPALAMDGGGPGGVVECRTEYKQHAVRQFTEDTFFSCERNRR